jgi:class 3 adenylate cyclase
MSFRAKLLLSILSLVAITTAATLKIAQDQSGKTYRALLDGMFRSQIESFEVIQEQRLEVGRNQLRLLSGSVRLFAALEEGDPELIYEVADVELRQADYDFYRLAGKDGGIIPASGSGEAGDLDATIESRLTTALKAAAGKEKTAGRTDLGFFATVASSSEPSIMYGVVSGEIINAETGQSSGTLILGKQIARLKTKSGGTAAGILLPALHSEGKIWSDIVPETAHEELKHALDMRSESSADQEWTLTLGDASYRADSHLLNPGSIFPAAHLVSLFPLEALIKGQRELFRRVAVIAVCALLAAAGVGLAFANRLSKPVHDLVKGTDEIKRGNFDVQVPRSTSDELGTLADSFNEMAAGLRLKEKYRSVLQLVTDREVAEELMSGAVQLGGETRDVSMIFCDVRGFTSISQDMTPADVVAMLNEHMSALTRVVHDHRGVVDKFVGDCIMTLFGAPKSFGRDAESAVRCAWRMIRAREALNESTGRVLRIGIGIASGPVLAGCMGSDRRLEYTVIGERVNLAARLCSAAGPMEVVIDESTRRQLPASFEVEAMEQLSLKGFSEKITAYRVMEVPA